MYAKTNPSGFEKSGFFEENPVWEGGVQSRNTPSKGEVESHLEEAVVRKCSDSHGHLIGEKQSADFQNVREKLKTFSPFCQCLTHFYPIASSVTFDANAGFVLFCCAVRERALLEFVAFFCCLGAVLALRK